MLVALTEMSLSLISLPCHAPAKWDAQVYMPADNKSGSTTAGGGEGSRPKEEKRSELWMEAK
jgi:hypothetical protein